MEFSALSQHFQQFGNSFTVCIFDCLFAFISKFSVRCSNLPFFSAPKFKKYDFRLKSMAAAGIPLAIANFQAEHAMLHCKNEDAYRYQEMRKQRLRERELKAQEAAAAAAAAAGENKQ